MLALKLGMSLVSSNGPGWSPLGEASLKAWYKKEAGITLNGSDVSSWADSSTNSFDMVQATATEQPAYSAGVLTFDPADTNNLTSASDIELSGDFTIGIRLNIAASGGVIVGDNTLDGELIKVFSNNKIGIRIDNQTRVDLQLDSGNLIASESYMLITRVSGTLTLHWNGTAQADTETMTGTANIDAIGVRKTDNNPFDGTIREIQIYSSSSASLTAHVNDRLAGL